MVEGFRTFIRSVSAGKGGRSTLVIQSGFSSSVMVVYGTVVRSRYAFCK